MLVIDTIIYQYNAIEQRILGTYVGKQLHLNKQLVKTHPSEKSQFQFFAFLRPYLKV
jgi:hypothetical protein